jgi:hypothetical protein
MQALQRERGLRGNEAERLLGKGEQEGILRR